MSDSGGFMTSITSVFNSAIDSAKSMMGGTTPAPVDPSGNPAPVDPSGNPAPPPPTEPSFEDKYLSFIPDDVRYYLTWVIKAIIPLLFAMIVANEMIIYKPSVRLFYFILTWCLCFFFGSFRWIIVLYYVLRLIFNKYKKSEGAGGGFFPTIYALLPWTTDKTIGRPFNYLLQYLTLDIGTQSVAEAFQNKSFQGKLKDAYYLGEKMVGYFDVLESADPYRGYGEIYDKNFEIVKKSLFEMHMPALEINHEEKQYIIQLHRSVDKVDGSGNNVAEGIIEYIQIGEHSIPPSPPKDPQAGKKDPLYMTTYDKTTNLFTLKTDNEAFRKDAEKTQQKEQAKAAKEAEEQSKKNAEEKQARNAEEKQARNAEEQSKKNAEEKQARNAEEQRARNEEANQARQKQYKEQREAERRSKNPYETETELMSLKKNK
jgi:hypothetical protein